jgi:uncharacterized protein (TIGR03000 family)
LNQLYANLQTKLAHATSDAEKARQESTKKDKEAAGWKRLLEDSAKPAGALEAKLTKALKDVETARSELAAKSKEAADLKSRADARATGAAADLAKLGQLRGDLGKAKSRVEALRQRLTDSETALAASQSALLERELNDLLAADRQAPLQPESTEPSRLPNLHGTQPSAPIKLTSQPVPARKSRLNDQIPALSGREPYAMITVFMPVDAELTFEGEVIHEVKQKGEKRIFHTPRLDPAAGTEYYLVGASWTDDSGEPVHRHEKLIVEPGKSYRIDLRGDRHADRAR